MHQVALNYARHWGFTDWERENNPAPGDEWSTWNKKFSSGDMDTTDYVQRHLAKAEDYHKAMMRDPGNRHGAQWGKPTDPRPTLEIVK